MQNRPIKTTKDNPPFYIAGTTNILLDSKGNVVRSGTHNITQAKRGLYIFTDVDGTQTNAVKYKTAKAREYRSDGVEKEVVYNMQTRQPLVDSNNHEVNFSDSRIDKSKAPVYFFIDENGKKIHVKKLHAFLKDEAKRKKTERSENPETSEQIKPAKKTKTDTVTQQNYASLDRNTSVEFINLVDVANDMLTNVPISAQEIPSTPQEEATENQGEESTQPTRLRGTLFKAMKNREVNKVTLQRDKGTWCCLFPDRASVNDNSGQAQRPTPSKNTIEKLDL